MKLSSSPSGTGPWVQAPLRLRAWVRASELALVLLAAVTGCLGGLAVAAMSGATQILREVLYRLPSGQRLSSLTALPEGLSGLSFLAPALGGAVLGLMLLVSTRGRGKGRRSVVDPIEANALHGGRMSLGGSLDVAAQNVVSNGCGASVGLEAGYTQVAAGLASRLGIAFQMRRSDLRTLVGCGSAAAIAAAFGSPLTGAFYAFELIIGTYTIATLAPVVVAALCGSLVARALAPQPALVDVGALALARNGPVGAGDTLPCLVLGLACAGFAVLLMRGVTLVERGFRASRLPAPVRPVLGGLCVGGLALATTPQILSAGHGALHVHLAPETATGLLALAGLIVAKAVASAVSIGSGFRGGLFFASLFLGALVGRLFAGFAPLVWPGFDGFSLAPVGYAVIGMSAFAAAIVGGPLTMTFLALEMTGSFPVTALVLASVIASALTVRKTFGYSFATWRFHLRGESIRSAHDVGWMRSLTVGRMMRKDIRPVPLDTPMATFLRAHPLGSPSRVVAVDGQGRYAGIILVPDAHARAAASGARPAELTDVVRYAEAFLLADMSVKQAAEAFDEAESEALAVLDGAESRRVIGLLTESHTLKRYSEELDRQRRSMLGEAA
ncbi:chloride channel protein [Methylorubrum zatmanii]|uniref:Chloride channel protein n=1 Tax=Methylorubrum zatmanii TaxID=29429 RepID=A0ABW1WUT8_9HYPH|nr:chloride channel protein [Methylorubrum zatmanii]MBD8905677.1 chloride channel protein [Methylorubrum zatmanii]